VAGRASPAGKNFARQHRLLVWSLLGVGLAVIAALWMKGGSYYVLPRAARLKSPLHPMFRASGLWGHRIGIAATAVMMLNYTYALRKRWSVAKGFGDIRHWLTFHVFVGSRQR
jgi:hypothetical protein